MGGGGDAFVRGRRGRCVSKFKHRRRDAFLRDESEGKSSEKTKKSWYAYTQPLGLVEAIFG